MCLQLSVAGYDLFTVIVSAVFGFLLVYLPLRKCIYNFSHKKHFAEIYDKATNVNENMGSEQSEELSRCKSVDCVRCNKWKLNKSEIYEKFERYLDQRMIDDYSRLRSIFEDQRDTHSVIGNFGQHPIVLNVPSLRTNIWWSKDDFKQDVNYLESHWKIIYQEFMDVFEKYSSNDIWSSNQTAVGFWKTFYFYNQGQRLEENCNRCPGTVEILDKLSCLIKSCVFGNALFSILHPGTTVAAHYGSSNIRIRCHLGLRAPKGCSLTVDGRRKAWEEGKCLLFDDSFLHSAEHSGVDSGDVRAILMVDFWHPDLTNHEQLALQHLYPSDNVPT